MCAKRGNSEGSITKRSDGLWEARISLPNGKRKSIYAKTRQEAARRLAEAIRDRDKGMLVVTERQAVEQYFTNWLATLKGQIRPRTWIRYEQYVRLHVVPTLGGIVLSKLTAQHLQTLYAAKLNEGLSQTTVNHLHMLIHKALHAALRLDLVQRNVSDLVDPPSMAHNEMAVLSPEQSRAFLEAVAGDRFEALYALALTTGMRQGEILGLQWSDVDLEHGTLQVRRTLYCAGREFFFTEPKTRKSRRTVLLTSYAIEALKRHRVRQNEERLALGPGWLAGYDLVFPDKDGGPKDNTILGREFVRLLKKAGLPRIRFHDLRHTVATLLFAQRVNPKVVSEMLGHSDIAITLGLYGHVTPPMQREATEMINRIFDDTEQDEEGGKNKA